MEKKVNREKISPCWAIAKGGKPNWNSSEESRHHWRKTFYINGVLAGKRVKKKKTKIYKGQY